jgi:integrase
MTGYMPQRPNALTAARRSAAPRKGGRDPSGRLGTPSPMSSSSTASAGTTPPATLSVYRSALLGPRTQTFLDDQAIATIGEFTAAHLQIYEEELRQAGLSVATVHQYHRVLKTFLGFCERQDFPVDTRVAEVEGPKLAQVEPSTFTVEEERRLVAGARSRRDKVLVEFMLKTGLRLSEVICVEVDDIVDLGDRGAYIKVRQGKGRKDRHVPLDASMYRRLPLYVDRHRPTGCPALSPRPGATASRSPLRGSRRSWCGWARRRASTCTRTSSATRSPRVP